MTVKSSESRRYHAIGRTAHLIAELLRGKELDRASAARVVNIGEAAAARQLNAIASVLPGAVVQRVGKRRSLLLDFSRLGPAPTTSVAVAACLGTSLSSLFEGSELAAGMKEALGYVLRASEDRERFRDYDRKFVFVRRGGEASLPARGELLTRLVDALLRERKVIVEYDKFAGDSRRTRLNPLSIAIYDHQLYLIGSSPRGGVRLYRFSRIHDVREDGKRTFQYPSTRRYQPESLFASSLGIFISDQYPIEDVELRLTGKWAPFARSHRWHRSQQVEVTREGVRVRLRVRLCPELEAWILSFGEDARVMSPGKLRRAIERRIDKMRRIARAPAKRRPKRMRLGR